MYKFLLRIAALVGIGYAAKQLSKKENRDRVVEEYNKAKEDPKKYAEDIQEKVTSNASDLSEKAKAEYSKVKEDPKAYTEDVQEKAQEEFDKFKSKSEEGFEKIKSKSEEFQTKTKEEFDKIKEDAKSKVQEYRKNGESAESDEVQESRFDDEAPVHVEEEFVNESEDLEEELDDSEGNKTIVTKNNEK